MIVHGLDELREMVEKVKPEKVFDEQSIKCDVCGREIEDKDFCPYCAEEDDILNEPSQELENNDDILNSDDEFYSKIKKSFDGTKGSSKERWADNMREELTKQGLKPLSKEEHKKLVKDKKIIINDVYELDEREPLEHEVEDVIEKSESPDNREASILTNARNRTSLEPSAGDALSQEREVCNKIVKISANTLQRIKNLRTTPTEPLGDVIRKTCEYYKEKNE